MKDNLDDESRTKVDAFLKWLEDHGGWLCRDFYYANVERMGLSIFSKEDEESDSTAICVPRDCCITAKLAYEKIMRLFEAKSIDKPALSGKEWIVFYLFLHKMLEQFDHITEREDSDESSSKKKQRQDNAKDPFEIFSQHKHYVRLLPDTTLSPLHYNKSELQLLRSTPLFGHAIESRKNSRISYYKATKWLKKRVRKMSKEQQKWARRLLASIVVPGIGFNVEDDINIEAESEAWDIDMQQCKTLAIWRWAETAYGSRAFPSRVIGETNEDESSAPVLVPGLDSFNHSRDVKVTWTWESTPEPLVTLTLHNGCKKGEQVFNSYGPKSNEELLASYGFVNEGMEDDAITLKLGSLVNGLPSKQHYWRYKESCPPALIDEVGEVLRDGEEWDELPPDDIDSIMGSQVVQSTILELLENKMSSFKATQEEVDKAIKQDDTIRPSVARAVQVYRNGQSRILQSAIASTQAREEKIRKRIDTYFDHDDQDSS